MKVPVSPQPDCFYGWDEVSIENMLLPGAPPQTHTPYVADDWLCEDDRPVTDVHWWGSYVDWSENMPPSLAPQAFHICIWTDQPKGLENPWSHPDKVVWEWTVPRTSLEEKHVGCDYYPERPNDSCFLYTFLIPQDRWFYQQPGPTVYWISIAALYPDGAVPTHLWGWKTRPHYFNDAAVRVKAPLIPSVGLTFAEGEPIYAPTGEPWDMAFELSTDRVIPKPTKTPTMTWTATPKPSATFTVTNSPTVIPTNTATPTSTATQTLTPTRTPTCSNPTDLNGDGVVNAIDLIEVISQWQGYPRRYNRTADFNCDDVIDYKDLMLFERDWH
jgi:hypothetical protein